MGVMNEQIKPIVKFIKKLPVIGDWLEPCPKVSVVRFAGVIADSNSRRQGISHHRFSKIIEKAFDKTGIEAVVLLINSPGGSPAQTSLIASQIRQLAEEKELPVFAFVEDVAASGGYWLACAADEIYTQDTSIVGSIGVISASFGFEDFIEKHGINRRVHTSGKEKSFLDPFVAEKTGDITRLKSIQKEMHVSFIDWVKDRRGEKLKGTDKDMFEGQFWTASPALDKGIIDGVGDVRSVMREKYGDNVKLIDLTPDRKIPLLGALSAKLDIGGGSLADDVLDTIETRAVWSRYGL